MSLRTGQVLTKGPGSWTEVPITDVAIARVEALAKQEGQPLIQDSNLLVEWRPNQPFDEDDEYDEDYEPSIDAEEDDIDLEIDDDSVVDDNDSDVSHAIPSPDLPAAEPVPGPLPQLPVGDVAPHGHGDDANTEDEGAGLGLGEEDGAEEEGAGEGGAEEEGADQVDQGGGGGGGWTRTWTTDAPTPTTVEKQYTVADTTYAQIEVGHTPICLTHRHTMSQTHMFPTTQIVQWTPSNRYSVLYSPKCRPGQVLENMGKRHVMHLQLNLHNWTTREHTTRY